MTTSKKVLLTGAAGYIGRATAIILRREGFEPVAIDNYATGSRDVTRILPCEEADLTDLKTARRAWKTLCSSSTPIAVMHFAARALVPESQDHPDLYFRNNLLATLNVASLAAEFQIPSIIHSSSCAVYGVPTRLPIDESCPLGPISAYGETKRASESILEYVGLRHGLRVLNLRYFNPAGALEDLSWGESHIPETHMVPNAVRCAISGETLTIFGKDHATPDGTCIRDYIHIEDLAYAHLAALRTLERKTGPFCDSVNVGAGQGTSVLDVVKACEEVTLKKLKIQWLPARVGDPPSLFADIKKASEVLGWRPTHPLSHIIRSQVGWLGSLRR